MSKVVSQDSSDPELIRPNISRKLLRQIPNTASCRQRSIRQALFGKVDQDIARFGRCEAKLWGLGNKMCRNFGYYDPSVEG